MGRVHSRHYHENRRRRSLPTVKPNAKKENLFIRRFLRGNLSTTISETTCSDVTSSESYPILPGHHSPIGQSPIYSPMPVISGNSYNNYPIVSYVPPSPMMMVQPRISPMIPPSSPSMPISYMQQLRVPPMYNIMSTPIYASAPVIGGNALDPLKYPLPSYRLVTDWTGGGKISPGFLGPPI